MDKKSLISMIMDKKSLISMIMGLVFLVTIHYYYFKTKLGQDLNFVALINIYIALCTVVTIYSIYLSTKINYANVINTQLSNINPLFENITEYISQFFTSNTNMNYYYNELFNGMTNKDESIRNIILEEIISNNILIKIDAIINYIDSYKISNGTNFQLIIMEKKLSKLLDKLMKSNIFIENWNKFKDVFALEWTKTYILINYGK
jgi:hypothetical protein